jgi:hypothetical protein
MTMRRRWLDRVDRPAPRIPDAPPPETPPQRFERPTVPYFPVVCPRCGSTKPKTTGSRGPQGAGRVRYHICQSCSLTFDSVEIRR